jgi:hypothetical protein
MAIRVLTLTICTLLAAVLPAAVTFDSSFECGNGTNFTLVGPDEYSFQMEQDTNATDRQWFYFSVAGASGQTLTFHLLGAGTSNVPNHWYFALPVASVDGGSTFSLANGSASYDGNTYTFSHTLSADPERIAFHYPYTLTRHQAQVSAWSAHPDVTHTVIGSSVQLRDIDLLTITNAASTPPGGKLGFWIVGRSHAAEVTGSFMTDGFMDFLLSGDSRAQALRDQVVIHCAPMLNPDGVVIGNYRKNFNGLSLNAVWDDPSAGGLTPEIEAVTDEITLWVSGGNSYDFFADLHSTSGGTTNFAFHPHLSIEPAMYFDPPNYADHLNAILAMIEGIAPDFDKDSGVSFSVSPAVSRQSQMLQYGVLSLLFEGTYNYTGYGPNVGQYMTPARHRAIGEALAIALHQWFNLGVPAGLAILGTD